MVNSQVTQEIINALKLNVSTEKIPAPIPMVEVGYKNVKNIITKAVSRTSTGANVILTSSSTQDTYVVGGSMSYSKSAACDIASGAINFEVNQNNSTVALASFAVQTLTAEKDTISFTLRNPIKIDRSSNVSMSGTFTAGALVRTGVVHYFLDEATNA